MSVECMLFIWFLLLIWNGFPCKVSGSRQLCESILGTGCFEMNLWLIFTPPEECLLACFSLWLLWGEGCEERGKESREMRIWRLKGVWRGEQHQGRPAGSRLPSAFNPAPALTLLFPSFPPSHHDKLDLWCIKKPQATYPPSPLHSYQVVFIPFVIYTSSVLVSSQLPVSAARLGRMLQPGTPVAQFRKPLNGFSGIC